MVDSVTVALSAVERERVMGLLIGISIFVVPIGSIVLLAKWPLPGGRFLKAAQRAAGTLAAFLYATIAFAFVSYDGVHVAQTPKARLARALGAPVIGALEKYRADQGSYPDSLVHVVPRYLAPAAYRAAQRSPLDQPFEYERHDDSFILRVRYEGPGVYQCEYASSPRTWYCSG